MTKKKVLQMSNGWSKNSWVILMILPLMDQILMTLYIKWVFISVIEFIQMISPQSRWALQFVSVQTHFYTWMSLKIHIHLGSTQQSVVAHWGFLEVYSDINSWHCVCIRSAYQRAHTDSLCPTYGNCASLSESTCYTGMVQYLKCYMNVCLLPTTQN